jgi:MOSC domain-containing protein YiiM
MKIHSIQVGEPQTLLIPDPAAKPNAKSKAAEEPGWFSAIFKKPVAGPLFLGKINLVGDAQGDLKNHGGPDKAICVYAHEHYAYWQRHFGLAELPAGAFGENFTTEGCFESNLCIGDTFAVGSAGEVVVQVSQPRQPCWKLARRWQVADMAVQVQGIGYTGWYFRVLQEGFVQPGDSLQLVERSYPQLTLVEANRIMHHDKEDWEAIARLLACPLLSKSWQKSLRFRLNRRAPADVADRIYGRS